MIAGCNVINLRDVARGWEQVERQAALQARAEVKLHSGAQALRWPTFCSARACGDGKRSAMSYATSWRTPTRPMTWLSCSSTWL